MLQDEVEHAVGVFQFLSPGFDGGVGDSEESIEDETGIVKGGDGLSAAGEGESAGSGGLADSTIDRETEGSEAGVFSEFSGHQLIDGDRVLKVSAL